jgi:hypothetical protein
MWRWLRIPATLALQVVKGNEKKLSVWGYNWAALSLEDSKI